MELVFTIVFSVTEIKLHEGPNKHGAGAKY